MNIWKLLVILGIVIAAIYIIPRSGKSTEIEQRGNELSIRVGKFQLTAAVIGDQIKNSFLVAGGSTGDKFYSESLGVIPLETVNQLARKYGNFRKCKSQGAYDAMRSMKSMLLYAANHDVERTLRKINKLAVAGCNTIIQMTYVQLSIINHTIEGQDTPVVITSNIPSFLVKDVKIIEKNRNF
ncbi:MAG: hypothetical protein RQ760_02995 [Sedimentisphaerales bacterium]|nr:hypothetical protein [Sedimentisphaerales bacterium]